MVHRPADSRLLANLLNHEKDYSKHLSILLEYSQSSLASFSAYAAACAPPTSQVIIAVAGALTGADHALRNYAVAVVQWQEQLKALKDMEDDVGNIMRDREILVTRLIKASKQKSTRDSILGGSPSGSTLSITKPEVQVGQKLSAAQAELQACEAQLAAKEQELNVFRTHTIRSGLEARCRAMVDCGTVWSEMGKEGVGALDGLDMANGHAPSQSASQIGHSSGPDATWRASSPLTVPTPPKPYTLHIPPAHSIGEYALPNGTLQHTTIEEEAGGGSSAEEDEGGVSVEVHENSRFGNGKVRAKTVPQAPPSRHVSFSLRGPKASTSAHPLGEPSSLRGDSPTKKSRTRAGSMLGSLAALFHVGGSRNDPEEPARTSPSKPQGRWQTRIDRNLAAARRGDSSDDELPALSHTYAPRSASPAPILLNSPVKGSPVDGGGDAHRLRKRAAKRGSVQVPSPARLVNADKGYASDTVAESVSKARAKSGKQSARAKPASELGVNGSAGPSTPKNGPGGGTRLKKSPNVAAALLSESQPSLSRNSSISKQSISSAASAPPRTTASAHTPTPSPLGRQNSSSRQRTASLNVTSTASGSSPSTPTKHKRTFSTSATPTPPRPVFTNGEPSLMTIVEGISRINKEAAIKQDPNRLLVVPKAPGPVNITVSESLGETSATGRQQAEGLPAPRPRPKKEGQPEENNYRNSLLMSASVSAPSLPIATASQPKPLPAKMPLRSALRNASRTPSPNPPQPQAAVPNGNASPTPLIIPAAIPRSATMSTITPELMMKRRESDISSISSYETGREVLDDTDEDEPPSPSFPVPPPPPPHDDHTRAPTGGSEVSTSTASTASTASPPVRRKSVRMSLPPTFSATPPALDDTDEDDNEVRGRHEPWSSRSASDPSTPRAEPSAWGTRIAENGTRDVWEDSSDEDAEYSAAKRLLARMSRKHEH